MERKLKNQNDFVKKKSKVGWTKYTISFNNTNDFDNMVNNIYVACCFYISI